MEDIGGAHPARSPGPPPAPPPGKRGSPSPTSGDLDLGGGGRREDTNRHSYFKGNQRRSLLTSGQHVGPAVRRNNLKPDWGSDSPLNINARQLPFPAGQVVDFTVRTGRKSKTTHPTLMPTL